MRAVRAAVAIAIAASACLFPDVSSLTNGNDASTDAPTADGAPPANGIANAQHVVAPTGDAQQTHIVWAIASKRWWIFYFDDDTTRMKTRSSADFITWQDGAELTLTHTNAGEGRNLSVAYAELGGVDVVHISMSHVESDAGPLVHTHTRAVINASTITFGAPSDVCSINASASGPDSPATFVDSDGTVWDSTGFVASAGTNNKGYQNEDVFLSTSHDDGTNWTSTFNQTTLEVVTTTANARGFFNAGGLGAVWEGGDQDPDPTNVHFAVFQSGSWTSVNSIFNNSGEQDPNDWGVANLHVGTTAEAHVVRALLAGGYEHAYGTGTSGQDAPAPPTQARTTGTGVVALADPSHLAAFDVSAAGELMESRWNAMTWSAWAMIAPTSPKTFLSGYCPDLDAHPEANGCAIIWTGPNSDGSGIFGQLVSVK